MVETIYMYGNEEWVFKMVGYPMLGELYLLNSTPTMWADVENCRVKHKILKKKYL